MNAQLPQSPDLPDILDVAPPVEVPEVPMHWAWWVLLALALLAIVAGLVWWWRQRRAPAETPKARALRRLETLQGQVSHMDGYQFGVAVSDILRSYLTEAHQLRASQQTSREFLQELESNPKFDERRRDRLREFLQACDFLKYAPAGKATDPNRDLLEQTNFFIREDLA